MSTINLPTGRDMVSILGEDYFKEEVKCDFLISEKMKKIWAVELDCYLEFARICDKYDLRYYAYGGTLLGAIRHKGFIPWDDDMDVCMPREDYEELLKVAQNELGEPYFMLTPYSDSNCFRTIVILINRKTTWTSRFFLHSGCANGLCLDIFPLDNYNAATHEKDLEEIRLSAKRCSQYMKRNDTDKMTPEHYASWKKYMTNDPMKEWENVQRVATKWNNTNTENYSMKVFVLSDKRYNDPLKKEWFDTSQLVKFETLDMRIPSGYHNILTATYGDYMKYPPIEKRGVWHEGGVADPEKPYTGEI